MAYDIGPKIGIDGESEFRKTITGINNNLKTLGTEMKVAMSEFNKGDKSVEALSKQNEVLNKQIDEQKNKLSELNKGLQASKEKYGENNEVTQGWQRSINMATAELNNMQRGLDNNKQAIIDMTDGVEDLGDSLDDTGKKSSLFGDMLKANLVSDVITSGLKTLSRAVGDLFSGTVGFANDSKTALNDLSAQTGATNEELTELDKTMKNIYKSGYGDDIKDIASSMGLVQQQTNASGKELEDMTKKSLLLRDSFDFDVAESVRTVNTLIKQFGIDGESAYNLIAQGAQNGLNQNGDLLDVINEYSVQFASTGLSAEEMFNMLANGAETGVWSIDKLGDSFKEFNIRVSDGTASDYLKMIGVDVNKTISDFNKGGDSAKKAMTKIATALKSTSDSTKQYQAGVGLFGTMYEDMGIDAVTALMNVQGQITTTKDSMSQLDEIKYDNIGSALAGLKRELQVNIAEPIQEDVLPVVQDLIGFVKDNGQGIADVVGNIANAVGDLFTWIVDNKDVVIFTIGAVASGLLAWNVVNMITGLVSAIKAFKLINEGATVSQYQLNLAMSLNPIGLIITAVVALVAGFVALIATNKNLRDGLVNGFKDIGKFFTDMWNTIVNGVKNLPNEIKKIWDNLVNKFNDAKTYIKNLGGEFITNLWEGIKSTWEKLKETVSNFFSKIGSDIKQALGFEGTELVSNTNLSSTLSLGNTRINSSSIPSSNTNNIYNVNIDAKNVKEFNDVVKLSQDKKSANRRVTN